MHTASFTSGSNNDPNFPKKFDQEWLNAPISEPLIVEMKERSKTNKKIRFGKL